MDRKLAAILAADVVGYSALMERDEAGTFDRLKARRKQLFEPEIDRHHGRVFKLMGDGLLAEFGSVVDAVECAVSIQRGMAERNTAVSADERIEARIGINLGEVIVEDDDRYGEGVNVAARLQQLADPGGICVSGKVATEVERKLAFGLEPMGKQKVKNIAEPVPTYRVLLDPAAVGKPSHVRRYLLTWRVAAAAAVLFFVIGLTAAWWRPWEPSIQRTVPTASAASDVRPALVVLPFDNLSDDEKQEYLANGFTEDLTTALARLPGLFVVSRDAAFAYKDKATTPAEISAALGVRYILEGSIRRVGDELRINAQLIDGSTSGHIWAERFDGQWAGVFALQDKVVVSIADALELRLVSNARADRAGGTNNPVAYDAYLKGMDIYYRGSSPQEFAQAVTHFQHAVQLDPNFGAAHAQLAWAYFEADVTRAVVMGLFSTEEAHANVHKALEAAATHPSPSYYQLIAELMVREHNSDEAVTVLLKSVALDPSDTSNYLSLANALNFNGRPKEALSYLDVAARVDPNSRMDYRRYQSGLAEFSQERFEEAARSIEKMDFETSEPWTRFYALQVLVSAYAHLGRTEQTASALERLRKVLAKSYDTPQQLQTQDYMVFKNTADIERLLAGLSRAGVPDLPAIASAGMDPKQRLTGAEIRSLVFNHETRGRVVLLGNLPIESTTTADGALSETVGTRTREGTSWVQGNFLCKAFPGDGTKCGAIFRNGFRTPGRDDEFKVVYRYEHSEFSVIR